MKKMQSGKEIIPVDIRHIRQSLNLKQKDMGWLIAVNSYPLGSGVPETRVAEWEMGWRPIPDYVFTAVARVLLNYWSDDRHKTPQGRQREVDVYYGKVLNQTLGEMFKLEQQLANSRDPQKRKLLGKARNIRIWHMKYLESLLHIQMAYVFDPDPGGEAHLEDVA